MDEILDLEPGENLKNVMFVGTVKSSFLMCDSCYMMKLEYLLQVP